MHITELLYFAISNKEDNSCIPIYIISKIPSTVCFPEANSYKNFHKNPSITICIIPPIDKPTNRTKNITSLVDVKVVNKYEITRCTNLNIYSKLPDNQNYIYIDSNNYNIPLIFCKYKTNIQIY